MKKNLASKRVLDVKEHRISVLRKLFVNFLFDYHFIRNSHLHLMSCLIDLVKASKPMRVSDWESLAGEYNSLLAPGERARVANSLKETFKRLVSMPISKGMLFYQYFCFI